MRSALCNRVASALLVAGLFSVAWTAAARAQTVGKVQGRVTDGSTGQPLAGAQVSFVDTRLGALTDDEGRYFVNSVPAGVYDIRADFIGYRTQVVTGQRVLAGQTTDMNFALESAPVEVEPLIVVGERNPLVPRDQVTSKSIVTGETVDNLPVDDIRDVLRLLPGVVETGSGSTPSVRGSRPGEGAIYVDGVLVRTYSNDAGRFNLPTNSLEELDVITGGFSVEFGESKGGVFNYITKSGGPSYNGSVSYQTDEFSPDTKNSFGVHRWEGSFGGPVFGNLSFFLSGAAHGQQSMVTNSGWDGVDILYVNGIDTTLTVTEPSAVPGVTNTREVAFPSYSLWSEGRRLPYTAEDQYQALGKLTFGYGTGSHIDVSYKRNRDQDRDWARQFLYDTRWLTGTRVKSNVWTGSLTHNITRTAESSLSLEAYVSYQKDNAIATALDPEWLGDNRSPAGGFTFGDFDFFIEEDHFPGDRNLDGKVNFEDYRWLMEDVRQNTCALTDLDGRSRGISAEQCTMGLVPFPGQTGLRTTQPFRMNPFGMSSAFRTEGIPAGYFANREDRFEGRANIDWQLNRTHRLKIGAEARKIRSGWVNTDLFDQIFAEYYYANPLRAAAYFEDKIDLGDVVLFGGVRWDHLSSDARYPLTPMFTHNLPEEITGDTVPGVCETSDVIRTDNRASDPCWPNNWFIEAKDRNTLSPRLGVSFPVTERSTFRLSYGHFVRAPNFVSLYSTIWSDLVNTNTNDQISRDLDFTKIITFEFGYRHLLAEDLVLDVSAYNTEIKKDVALRKLPFEDPSPARAGVIQFYNVFTNSTFGNNRGIDIKLDKRFGSLLDITAAYSFERAEATDSDPFTYTRVFARQLNNLSRITGQPTTPAQSLLLQDHNRTHTVAGSASLTFPGDFLDGSWAHPILRDVSAFLTFRYASGLPYSLLVNDGVGVVGPPTNAGLGNQLVREDLNTFRTAWINQTDLRVTKDFSVGPRDVRVFADLRNVLDFRNIVQIFLETGTTRNEQFRNEQWVKPELDRMGNQDLFLYATDAQGLPACSGEGCYVQEALTNLELAGVELATAGPEVDAWGLIAAERRFGDGDGTYTIEEQTRALNAAYDMVNGEHLFLDAPRQIRFGVELRF